MPSDERPSQRRLVGLRVRFADGEMVAKYVFPFVGRDWSVELFALDLPGLGPRWSPGPLDVRTGLLELRDPSSALAATESIPLERFRDLVHFDPWWTFRGIARVDPRWVRAVVGSNLAGPFDLGGRRLKVHDLIFDPHIRRLESLVAQDDRFHRLIFGPADLDLWRLLRHS